MNCVMLGVLGAGVVVVVDDVGVGVVVGGGGEEGVIKNK